MENLAALLRLSAIVRQFLERRFSFVFQKYKLLPTLILEIITLPYFRTLDRLLTCDTISSTQPLFVWPQLWFSSRLLITVSFNFCEST